ncbi:MAG TPA: glycosyltransferase family 4 protein, partial [Candidatus Sulfotelmatobacter sp.]|nr:glycosyltransferase family 4 protein [Candidatus Sulfotelmatobacter sp.]
ELPLVEDYDYWLRTARLFSLGRLDAVLYDLRLHPSSLTSTLSLEHKQQLYVRMLAKQRQGEAPVASRTWRRAMASLHAAYGRDYFFAGKTGPARRNLLSAIRLDPAHLLRWGLAGPLLKSLVGDDLLAWIRRGRRPGAPPAGKPFRLLHCYATFGANQGGTERQARLICGALVARGHRVSVLTRRDTGQGRPPNGVAVHACIWTMDRVRLFGTTYLATAIYHLVRLGRRADLLHAHQLYLDAIAALVAGRILRLPVVAKMVGAGAGGDLDRLRKTKGGGVLLRLLHCLDAVVVPSRTCRDELLRAAFPPQRIYLIPNGVDTHAYRPPVGPASSALPGLRGRLVVYTGRLIEAKGLLELLEAWRLVVVEAPDAHLVLVGSGPLEAELRRQAADAGVADCVHFRGEVPDVRPYLQAAAAFVFPSWAEGLPNSLLEAMATGLPCVATRIPPIEELITDGQHGLLVPREAPTALAAALVSVLTGSALAARLGRAARRRVEMEYDLSSALDQLEALYQQLCGKGRRGGIVLNEPPDGRPVATRSECPSHLYEVRRVSAP